MIVIFSDGSTKIEQQCVVTSALVVNTQNNIVSEVLYCSKNVYHDYYNDSIHELLAIKDSLEIIRLLEIKDEPILIISDSVEIVKCLQTYKENSIWSGKEIAIPIVEKISHLYTDNIYLEWQPRTTLGLNVVDFLNKEVDSWTNTKDKPYLTTQMKKLLKKSYDYNISSKKQGNTFRLK